MATGQRKKIPIRSTRGLWLKKGEKVDSVKSIHGGATHASKSGADPMGQSTKIKGDDCKKEIRHGRVMNKDRHQPV